MNAVFVLILRMIRMPLSRLLNWMLLCYDSSMDFAGLHFGLTSTGRCEERHWKKCVKEMEFREKMAEVSNVSDESESESIDHGEVTNHLFQMNRSEGKLEHVSSEQKH